MNGTLGFGKHKDTPISDVPEQYLRWLLDQQTRLCATINSELERREAAAEASMTWLERIVVAGYRDLSKRHIILMPEALTRK